MAAKLKKVLLAARPGGRVRPDCRDLLTLPMREGAARPRGRASARERAPRGRVWMSGNVKQFRPTTTIPIRCGAARHRRHQQNPRANSIPWTA